MSATHRRLGEGFQNSDHARDCEVFQVWRGLKPLRRFGRAQQTRDAVRPATSCTVDHAMIAGTRTARMTVAGGLQATAGTALGSLVSDFSVAANGASGSL